MTDADPRMAGVPTYRYAPSRGIAGALLVVAVIAAIEAIMASSATGRLVISCAAIVLAAIAVTDLIFTPRLSASDSGIAVFTPTVRVRLRWSEIDIIRVDERSHRGLALRALEIEAGERLIVLSRRSLGRDPRDVYTELAELRART